MEPFDMVKQDTDGKEREAREELLQLIRSDALIVGEMTQLSSGRESDLYIDAKMVTLHPRGAYLTSKVLFDHLRDLDADAIGGMTIGADPIVGSYALFSHLQGKPMSAFIIRKEPKKHGKQKLIEGPLKENAKVVIIDDVTTTGGSLLDGIKTIEELPISCTIVKVITLVDRMEGGTDLIKNHGYDLDAIFTKQDLLDVR